MGIIISDKDKLIQDLYKKMTKVTDVYSTTHKVVHWGDVQEIVEKFFIDKNSDWLMAKTEPTISKMEQVDKDINVRSKDEPKTEDDKKHCVFCKWVYEPNVCGRCRNMNLFADTIEDEPQTCFNCKHNVTKHTFDHACGGCTNMNRWEKDEPQTNADQHVQHIGSVETMSCQECKHWDCPWK